MIIVLISIIIAGVMVHKLLDHTSGEKVFFICIFGALFTFILTLITFVPTREWYDKTSTVNIVASKSDHRIEGEFSHGIFYSRMKVEDKDYYFVMEDHGGSYTIGRCLVENTVIKETDGHPRMKRSYTYVTSSLPQWVRFKEPHGTLVKERDTIFVPRGTVVNNIGYEIF